MLRGYVDVNNAVKCYLFSSISFTAGTVITAKYQDGIINLLSGKEPVVLGSQEVVTEEDTPHQVNSTNTRALQNSLDRPCLTVRGR